MRNKIPIIIITVVIDFILLSLLPVASWDGPRAQEDGPKPPRLIVFISVDQLRYESLSRFEPFFGNDGFRYLRRSGADFNDCRYGHATLFTAVGHATMASGTYPNVHGIVSNDWYDRVSGKRVYAVEDSSGAEPGNGKAYHPDGRSPQYFLGTSIGDEMKLHSYGQSKVFGISNKDRAAILMTGVMADGVYWWNLNDGRWISSRHYMNQYPHWVSSYNKTKPLDKWFGKTWGLLLDSSMYPFVDPDVMDTYDVSNNMGMFFPHRIGTGKKPDKKYYLALRTSPFGAEALNEFAARLIIEESLGKDSIPDLLCISYSPGDYIGHQFGPYSRETMDYMIRMDAYLAQLFGIIDRQVGLDQTLIVLTSDHGIAPLPKTLEKMGLTTARVSRDSVIQRINACMTRRYGPAGKAGGYIIAEEPNFYFDPAVLKEKKIEKIDAENYIKGVIVQEQWQGVFRVYTFHELITGAVPKDEISAKVHKSFHPARSGDLFIVLNPFHIWYYNGKGTEHGQLYAYDTHVPLFLSGSRWIRPGRYHETVSPVDIAPTLSVILRTAFPSGTVGKALAPCMK